MDVDIGIRERFRGLVEASDQTQLEIAKAIGCEGNAFRQYCTGRTTLPIRYWQAFCQHMKVSVDYLVTGQENPVMVRYRALDEDETKIVDKFLFPEKPKDDLKKTKTA